MKEKVSVFWFRRDLRVTDNHGLYNALRSEHPVLCVFFWDPHILSSITKKDNGRVTFIHHALEHLQTELHKHHKDILVYHTTPQKGFAKLLKAYDIQEIHWNHDYDPTAHERDQEIIMWAVDHDIQTYTYKDHVLFEKEDVLTDQGKPYTVFTPYAKKWRALLEKEGIPRYASEDLLNRIHTPVGSSLPSLEDLGFTATDFSLPPRSIPMDVISSYHKTRDIPSLDHGTSRLGIHLRFGTLSIRTLITYAQKHNDTYLNELIWREFYQMILWHFPHVTDEAFKPAYDKIPWRNNKDEFARWCAGTTGYPIVDAGMRQLVQTGYMHNRVRMITASFLTKHLLIDWRWGEQFFADYLLDYERAANNGGWQWAAGSGCDAAPYFRVFNPTLQQEKFDPDFAYIKHWVPEYGTDTYPAPMVDHKEARTRVLAVYKEALNS